MKREIIRYEMVENTSLHSFQCEINRQLKRGFSLYGETFVYKDTAYNKVYHQVTVKYQDAPVKSDIE